MTYSRPRVVEADKPDDTALAASLDKLGNSHLCYLDFVVRSSARAPSAQFLHISTASTESWLVGLNNTQGTKLDGACRQVGIFESTTS
jgi:hypothetical protein